MSDKKSFVTKLWEFLKGTRTPTSYDVAETLVKGYLIQREINNTLLDLEKRRKKFAEIQRLRLILDNSPNNSKKLINKFNKLVK